MLYPPLASGGSQDRYYLIYQDRAAADAAAAIIPWLDVPASADDASTTPLYRGVRQLMDLAARVVPPESRELTACIDALRQSTANNPQTAWASWMLIGRVEMDFRFNEIAARTAFEAAEKRAVAGSIEQLMAAWAQAETYSDAVDVHRRQCERIVRTFLQHRASHIYQRAEAVLNPPTDRTISP